MFQMPNDKASAIGAASSLNQAMREVGFDWDGPLAVIDKVKEELAELIEAISQAEDKSHILEEYGDLLLVCLHLGAHLQLSPELAISQAVDKCRLRFDQLKQLAKLKKLSLDELSLSEMESLWNEVKKEKSSSKS